MPAPGTGSPEYSRARSRVESEPDPDAVESDDEADVDDAADGVDDETVDDVTDWGDLAEGDGEEDADGPFAAGSAEVEGDPEPASSPWNTEAAGASPAARQDAQLARDIAARHEPTPKVKKRPPVEKPVIYRCVPQAMDGSGKPDMEASEDVWGRRPRFKLVEELRLRKPDRSPWLVSELTFDVKSNREQAVCGFVLHTDGTESGDVGGMDNFDNAEALGPDGSFPDPYAPPTTPDLAAAPGASRDELMMRMFLQMQEQNARALAAATQQGQIVPGGGNDRTREILELITAAMPIVAEIRTLFGGRENVGEQITKALREGMDIARQAERPKMLDLFLPMMAMMGGSNPAIQQKIASMMGGGEAAAAPGKDAGAPPDAATPASRAPGRKQVPARRRQPMTAATWRTKVCEMIAQACHQALQMGNDGLAEAGYWALRLHHELPVQVRSDFLSATPEELAAPLLQDMNGPVARYILSKLEPEERADPRMAAEQVRETVIGWWSDVLQEMQERARPRSVAPRTVVADEPDRGDDEGYEDDDENDDGDHEEAIA